MNSPGKTPIRRVLSKTPLARGYETALAGERKARRRIPWDKFRRRSYPEAALSLAADAQLRLAEGEYHAVGLFGRIASGVAMAGAPFDIVAASTRISSDEIRHADYCTRLATLCAGDDVTLSIDRQALADAAPVLPQVDEADFLVAKYAATGETLAAALLRACRERAKDPVARAHFSAILGDEVHHAHFGWYYLAWRAPLWTLPERQAVADRLGEFVADIEWALWFGRDAPESARAAADALGVLDSESQRAIVRDVMENEIVPGLDALGLGASHAWRARRRGGTDSKERDLVFGGPRDGALRRRDGGESSAASAPEPSASNATDRAAAWLAAQIAPDGAVQFAVDARTRAVEALGPLHHGRTAIVVHALERHGGHGSACARARARLMSDLRTALAGRTVAGFPDDPILVAATLALAALAGLDVRADLAEAARSPELERAPWYAAEVATALGSDTPPALWKACVGGLDGDPWAPWTALAARRIGDLDTLARVERTLIGSVHPDGSVHGPEGPEVARTAVVVEALSPFSSESSREAAERAVGFLKAAQLAELDPDGQPARIDGGFPLTPESPILRVDVTAHAVLALVAWDRDAERD